MKRCIALIAILTLLLTFSMPALAADNRNAGANCETAYSREAINQLIRDLLEKCFANAPGSTTRPDCTLPPVETPAPDTQTPTPDNTPEPGETPEPPTQENDFAAEVVRLVNEERAKHGLKALSVEDNLTNAAQLRAVEIKTRFSHTRPDGTSCFTALKEHDVSYRGAGENIASGQRTPEAVMEGWMNSQGHRENILNGSFTKIGVGCYQDAAGRYHWAQLFIY